MNSTLVWLSASGEAHLVSHYKLTSVVGINVSPSFKSSVKCDEVGVGTFDGALTRMNGAIRLSSVPHSRKVCSFRV